MQSIGGSLEAGAARVPSDDVEALEQRTVVAVGGGEGEIGAAGSRGRPGSPAGCRSCSPDRERCSGPGTTRSAHRPDRRSRPAPRACRRRRRRCTAPTRSAAVRTPGARRRPRPVRRNWAATSLRRRSTSARPWTLASLGVVSELVAVGLSSDEHPSSHSANPTTTTRLDTSQRLRPATGDRMAPLHM